MLVCVTGPLAALPNMTYLVSIVFVGRSAIAGI